MVAPGAPGAPGDPIANLDERERKRREAQAAFKGPRPPNWPRCRPWIYHSIADEIEVPLQRTVRALYYSWYLVAACCLVNSIACLLLLTTNASAQAGSDFGWSILYLALLPPLSFLLWYRPAYNAFMKDSSLYFYIFFIFNGFHLAFVIYMLVGFPGTGCSGFINVLSLFSGGHKGEGVVGIVALLMWAADLAIGFTLFFRVRLHSRRRGHSFQEARNQAINRAATSDAATRWP